MPGMRFASKTFMSQSTIQLYGHGKLYTVVVDKEDMHIIRAHNWNVVKRGPKRYVYSRCINKYLHRLIMLEPPLTIDHIDGNPLNNSKSNLRAVSHKDNMQNRIKSKQWSSEFYGVCWAKHANKWRVTVTLNGQLTHLGYFVSELEAAKAYNNFLDNKNDTLKKRNKL